GFSMYGSMATIIASMIWLYCCMYILFICAEINNHFANSIINNIKERKAARVGRKG
ncbi:MAG: YihY/virulence factor BrkB family protein, partial [Lachnospiraceae bacterium]|nr:YihY/virulence factor BrkB family protein [Lachnospiraceae bacterium]